MSSKIFKRAITASDKRELIRLAGDTSKIATRPFIELQLGLYLPREVADEIAELAAPPTGPSNAYALPMRNRTSVWRPDNPATVPPSDGSCPFMALPTEIRRAIFAESLPAKTKIFLPTCDDQTPKAKTNTDAKMAPPKRNCISDLMCINKTIKDEIALVLYEERIFAVHVHEGIRDGGIEFLGVGRQPLQYQDNIYDRRFTKFTHDGDFSFHRLKKIHIIIYPSEDVDNSRHGVLNTYFMNLALCRLLDCSNGEGKDNRINRISINFASKPVKQGPEPTGRRAVIIRENYWWDVDRKAPRETSIHGLSNAALVLRPFSTLRCHDARVYLPNKVDEHEETVKYVRELMDHMRTDDPLSLGFVDDRIDQQIEAARIALEDHICHTLYGVKERFEVKPITAEELGYGYGGDDNAVDEHHDGHEASQTSPSSAKKRRRSPGKDPEESPASKSSARKRAESDDEGEGFLYEDDGPGNYTFDDDLPQYGSSNLNRDDRAVSSAKMRTSAPRNSRDSSFEQSTSSSSAEDDDEDEAFQRAVLNSIREQSIW